MIVGRNIVCIASSWFDHPTSKHHIMRILAEQNHVVWVGCHAARRPRLTRSDASAAVRRLQKAWAGLRRVHPQIDVLSPLLVPLPESRLARHFNARVLARQIGHALRDLPPRPTQLWLFTPDVPELSERLPAEHVVYYCVDEFSAFSGFNAGLIEELERCTMAAADVVIATSAELYDARRRQHPNTHLVLHGVDFEHFAAAVDSPPRDAPADIRAIPRPILGYFGVLSDYVDLELISQAARRKPEWSFVLIGDATCRWDAVAGLDNVHALGGRPYEALPAYCSCFDIGLIPFRMNRLTRAANPIKLREYLAAGLPVVSAPMPAVMDYVPAVHPAETADEFVAACTAALAARDEASRRARQELVRSESWRRRVEQLSQIVLGPAARGVAEARAGVEAGALVTVGRAT